MSTMLLALARASRVSANTNLNLKLMARFRDKYIFYFDKLHKSSEKWEALPFITYHAFPQDKFLSVTQVFDEYVDRAITFREN